MVSVKCKGIGFILIGILMAACGGSSFTETPVSLENYVIEEGFQLSCIAAEPLLEAPVTMDFDDRGRMWVVEMRGYMMNLDGIGEDTPNGRIVILEDNDQNGVADHAKVFLDKLVVPRAIAHVYGGLLYAEPPNLWFVEINNDEPGKKMLVDSLYADAGNIEHQPNGLMMNIDNWIYNANSNFRYRLKDSKWLKEPTSYRGQWGISKDNFGRLYYNSNARQLKGDFVLPNTFIENRYFKPQVALNNILPPDDRVYPLHATAVNRGYRAGELDSDSLLVNVTSACGPLIYRGNQFPGSHQNNAFICSPEANLIKRNILHFEATKTTARQAIVGKEFIASTDEGFRPVNLFNGPDGAMYIVDMHRGIIQHKAYISQYLTKKIREEKLDTIMGMGRILKVEAKDKEVDKGPNFTKLSDEELVSLLKSSNGWTRDRAQQLLISRNADSVVGQLRKVLEEKDVNASQLHALYTLEGLGELTFEYLHDLVVQELIEETTIAHILTLLRGFAEEKNLDKMLEVSKFVFERQDTLTDLYLAATLGPWINLDKPSFFEILAKVGARYLESVIFHEAMTNSLRGVEEEFLSSGKVSEALVSLLETASEDRKNENENSIYTNVSVGEDARTNGLKLYRSICGSCHGPAGNGIQDVGPPLKKSEYVTGPVQRLALVILHGMTGPVHVNNKRYEFATEMPAMSSSTLSDQDIVDVIHFLQNAFGQPGNRTSTEEIKTLREMKPISGGMYTEEELNQIEY